MGATDSPQATLIPLGLLADNGLEPHKDFTVMPFDLLRGKHGDHIGGERDAARALMRGECDAACLIDGNHLLFIQEGTIAVRCYARFWRKHPYTITAISPCWTLRRGRQQHDFANSCWKCRMRTLRCGACSTSRD